MADNRMIYALVALLFCFISGPVFSDKLSTGKVSVIGEAFLPGSEQLRYREYHTYSEDGLDHRVLYENADGRLLADKRVDYRSGRTTPEFTQTYNEVKHETAVRWQDQVLHMSFQSGSGSSDKSFKTQNLEPKIPVVVDAGFVEFIRLSWQDLLKGKKINFMFPLVTRSKLVELRVNQSACSYETTDDVCFKMEMSNWLFRMLLDPIELGFDSKTRNLQRYRGLSNIEDKNGDGLVVDIHYRYPLLKDSL